MAATNKRIITMAAAAAFGLAAPSVTWAGTPVELSNSQLDHITAGGAIVISSADAAATGVLTLTGTNVNSIVAGGQSAYPQQPAFTNDAGASDGTAVSVGSNLSQQNAPPASSGTAVNTAGAANGNLVINHTFNHTTHGVGGVTFQAGWTFVYGAWVGL